MNIKYLSLILLVFILQTESRFPKTSLVQDMWSLMEFKEQVLQSKKWWYVVFGGKFL